MNPRKPSFHCWVLLFFFCIFSLVGAYDPLDPQGNITIKWDIMLWGDSKYDANVYILNNQLFRHIERPGWKLQWDWKGDEVIWHVQGAEAIEQGNCHKIKGDKLPHCCKKTPQIVDLLPGAPYTSQTTNCCRGGVLSSMKQDPARAGALFQMNVGNALDYNTSTITGDAKIEESIIPENFSLGIPGYTCSPPLAVTPSKFLEADGRRTTQAFLTWNITCTYSQFVASPVPTCCVSLSAFYNDTITYCPQCSCGCQHEPGVKCVKPGHEPEFLELPHNPDTEVPPKVLCTKHMCPIRIHWHVKTSYTEYWRVKITINNFNYVKNYSDWTLVVQHPNLRSVVQVFSFDYHPLNQHGPVNDSGVFFGLKYYNDMLLQAGPAGNVQTEILLRKERGIFTFANGWTFPTKISFNGHQCVMPEADKYPRLPNHSSKAIKVPFISSMILLLTSFVLQF